MRLICFLPFLRFAGYRHWNRLASAVRTVLITFKQGLDGRSYQEQSILAHLFRIISLKGISIICLLLIEVVSILFWFKRGIDPLFQKSLPVIVTQPNVLFHFWRSIESESITRLTLKQLINEISGFKRPASWQVTSFDLHLFCKNHITNFLTAATDVGSSTQHELISNHSYGKVVDSVRMILATHYFGSHVARCTRGVRGILGFQNFCDSHICDTDISILLHDNVFRLDISMNYALVMHVFETEHHASHHKLCFRFRESSSSADVVPQVTTCQQITDEV